MGVTIFGRAENARTRSLLAIAKHENVEVSLSAPEGAEFQAASPAGKIPALKDGDYTLTETVAIAVYLAQVNRSATTTASIAETVKNAVGMGSHTLLGTGLQERALILQWTSFANMDLLETAAKWFKPLTGAAPHNKKDVDSAEEKVRAYLEVINKHLLDKTFLVTERPTLADFVLTSVVQRGNELIFDKDLRAAYPNIFRHYNTVYRQGCYNAVAGASEPAFIETAVKYTPPAKEAKPAKEQPKKKEKKAAEKDDDDEDDQPPPAPKAAHPIAALGNATCFPLDELKRQYSNLDTPVFLKWFAEKYNPQEYSLWHVVYKYPEELTQIFMTSNLVTGLHTRLEGSRKYLFGNMLVYGVKNDNAIRGVYLVRGASAKDAFDVAPDAESYDFHPLNWENAEDRALTERVWLWDDVYNGKEYADGKTFK